MKYIYITRQNDRTIIADYKSKFEQNSPEELIVAYNEQQKCGIVGVHQQALYLIALRLEFIERFGESPILIEDNIVISLSGKIALLKGRIFHLN